MDSRRVISLTALIKRLDRILKFEEKKKYVRPAERVRRKERETVRTGTAGGILAGGISGGLIGHRYGERQGIEEVTSDSEMDAYWRRKGASLWGLSPEEIPKPLNINSKRMKEMLGSYKMRGAFHGASIGAGASALAGISGAHLLNRVLRSKRERSNSKT